MVKREELLEKGRTKKRESKYLDFKSCFDVNSPQDWCEIIKDIVAMANTGGGIIVFGFESNGVSSSINVTPILEVDPAQITDKIAKYTGEQFSEFELTELRRNGHKGVALLIEGIAIPMVFTRPGTYAIADGRQKTAFGKGTMYFRHGAKSEPANSNDLRRAFGRELERHRKSWLGNLRKVVKAPVGSKVQVLHPREVALSGGSAATAVRIVDDPNAPAVNLEKPDTFYPHRQKEIIQLTNDRLGKGKTVNAFDIQTVRKVHKIDETKPQFYYKSKYAAPQYSDAFVGWLMGKYEEDNDFFEKARESYRALTKKTAKAKTRK